jgi:regulator of replication initiation timing
LPPEVSFVSSLLEKSRDAIVARADQAIDEVHKRHVEAIAEAQKEYDKLKAQMGATLAGIKALTTAFATKTAELTALQTEREAMVTTLVAGRVLSPAPSQSVKLPDVAVHVMQTVTAKDGKIGALTEQVTALEEELAQTREDKTALEAELTRLRADLGSAQHVYDAGYMVLHRAKEANTSAEFAQRRIASKSLAKQDALAQTQKDLERIRLDLERRADGLQQGLEELRPMLPLPPRSPSVSRAGERPSAATPPPLLPLPPPPAAPRSSSVSRSGEHPPTATPASPPSAAKLSRPASAPRFIKHSPSDTGRSSLSSSSSFDATLEPLPPPPDTPPPPSSTASTASSPPLKPPTSVSTRAAVGVRRRSTMEEWAIRSKESLIALDRLVQAGLPLSDYEFLNYVRRNLGAGSSEFAECLKTMKKRHRAEQTISAKPPPARSNPANLQTLATPNPQHLKPTAKKSSPPKQLTQGEQDIVDSLHRGKPVPSTPSTPHPTQPPVYTLSLKIRPTTPPEKKS